jgi:transcriptional regulator of NAD metabolism
LIKQKYSSELELEQSIDEAEVMVQDLANLGVQYYILGRQQEALSCYERVRKPINGNHSSDKLAVAAVDAVNNCAVQLIGRDDMGRAGTILKALLSKASKSSTNKKVKRLLL